MAKRRQENQARSPGKPAQSAETAAPVEPKAKREPKSKPTPKKSNKEMPWHPFWRFLVSLLVLFHVLAVFSAPWDIMTVAALPPGFEEPRDNLGRPLQPPPEAYQEPIVTRTLRSALRHYLNALYLNHGYEFFAPDPAGTHVVDYTITQPDGTTIEGRFPDLKEHWPRLLYHRHMMLADQAGLLDTELTARTQQSGKSIPFIGEIYADYLATKHGGQSELVLKLHRLLSPQQVLAEVPLTDESTYRPYPKAQGSPRNDSNESPTQNPSGELPVMIPGAKE